MKSFGTATLKTDHAKGRVWVIDAKPSVMMRLKRLFMGADRQGNGKHIVVADTLETCRDLAWVCERWPLEVTPRAYLDERTARHVAAEEAIDRILAAGYTPREFEMALRPRDYQRVAADLAQRAQHPVRHRRIEAALGLVQQPGRQPLALAVAQAVLLLEARQDRDGHLRDHRPLDAPGAGRDADAPSEAVGERA